ncbi:MAG: tRNA 2-thiocytidine biosynthesis protein TtcA [Bacilli bacterium]|nr:tRNA 2-thiocytidine biosynthesis protein TtcA [Bacilli bacterium]
MEKYQEIERSIIKKFRKEIYGRFVSSVYDYKLIEDNDKIMVCISGGKDSFLLAKCIEEFKKHGFIKFDAKYVVMDPGYNEINRQMIEENAKILNVDLEIFESDIFSIVSRDTKSPCYLCARMRRGCLYNKAKELGCNKIALGHHFNDVIETTLLSLIYGSEIKTMMPKLHSENFSGLELIRPLYKVHEEDILAWVKYNNLHFINCACRFTENCSLNDSDSKRLEMKNLIKQLKKTNLNADYNIFKALDNVNLNCVLGTKNEGIYKSFLDIYDNRGKDL